MAVSKVKNPLDKEIEEVSHRIRLLETENKRAVKRVLETKKKIDDINKARERYIDTKTSQHAVAEQRARSIESRREQLGQERKQQYDKHFFIQHELLKLKQAVGRRGRDLKSYVMRSKQQTDIDDRRRRKQLHEAVLLSKRQATMRMKLLEDYKARNFQNYHAKLIEFTDQQRARHERNILDLAQREQELLERVNKAQDMQQSALNELEDVLQHEH